MTENVDDHRHAFFNKLWKDFYKKCLSLDLINLLIFKAHTMFQETARKNKHKLFENDMFLLQQQQ